MKIIQANSVPITFLAFTGGQLAYLRDQGLEVVAITSPGDGFEEFEEREKIKVYPVRMLRAISPMRDLVALYQLIMIIRRERPALVQGSTTKAGLLAMMAAAITGRPALFFMRGLRHSELIGWKRTVVYYMERLTCALADRVLCTSPCVMHDALESGLTRPEKTSVLHNGTGNGIDYERFDPTRFDRLRVRREWGLDSGAVVLLFAGRLVRDKGIVEMAECWRSIKDRHPNLYLILAGSIEKEDPAPPEVLEYLRGEERVMMPGHVKDMAPLYAMADLLVHPTYREGMPIVPLEASAMEVPVVTTRATGCADAVTDGETGVLVAPKDSSALTQAVEHLLERPELRERMGKAGRRRVIRDFRPRDVWEALYQEYVKLLIARGVIARESDIKERR